MTARKKNDDIQADRLPLLPLRDVVVFPHMVVPLLVGRPASVAAVEAAVASEAPLLLVTQTDPGVETPEKRDLHAVGIAANVLQTLRMPDGTLKVVVEGLARGRVLQVHQRHAFLEAAASPVDDVPSLGDEAEALVRTILNQFEEYVRLSQRIAPEIVTSLRSVSDSGALSDMVAAHLAVRVEERQELLETEEIQKRLEVISGLLMRENELLAIEQKVRDRVRDQVERGQREFYLQEQLKAIHQELGSFHEGGDEFAELREQVDRARMPSEAKHKAIEELGRYTRTPAMSPEGAVIRTYLEWLIEMPWRKRTRDAIDLDKAKAILDEDHYGLDKVKERILEFLAVRKLSKRAKGPILCLVGPPGVGKTSLGRSIARAMGRKFVRVSLGGVRDEAEVRGHRRTYIGSLPGRIIQGVRKAGVRNPLFMLDEVDKMNADFRGDPASALLEVLDPEQNHAFSDHYLEVEFDLREVFFITTANTEYDIPPALHDRMEVVRLPGYTVLEKERIANLFLIPKQKAECGLTDSDIRFTKEALQKIIRRYTQEAGVRELERKVATICRKVARKVVSRRKTTSVRKTVLKVDDVTKFLGPEEYSELRAEAKPQAGVAVGLAWTFTGGDILCIETSTMKGKGELTLTGQLGDVMKESAQAAYTYLRAHAQELRISGQFHKSLDFHVHVPEAAIPKDGPSAGVPLAVSMLSALRNKPPKARLAMTGEITLRGRVLPVGGVKEKVIAAHRAGIRTVAMPRENEKDLLEIPKEVKQAVEFVFIDDIGDAFRLAFSRSRAK